MQHAEVQLSAQRLRELMLWHGKDEGNLPPAATLANLSRDTIAALAQLQLARSQLTQLRATLSHLFWVCGSGAVRRMVLDALGAPPDSEAPTPTLPVVTWQASPNGLPAPTATMELPREKPTPQHAAG
jgi:hypothetical protein